MTVIESGRPVSAYFVILQPKGIDVADGEEIKLKHPRQKNEMNAVCVGRFTESWTSIPDSFCLLSYGRNAAELRKELIKRNAQYEQETTISFLMLRAIQ